MAQSPAKTMSISVLIPICYVLIHTNTAPNAPCAQLPWQLYNILHLVKAQCHPESKVRKSVLRGRRPAPLFSKWQTCVRVLGPMSRSRTSKRHAKRINLPLQIYLNFAFQKNIFCSFHRLFVVFLVRRHRKRELHNKIKWTCGQNNVTGRKSEFNPLPNNIRWPLWHHTMYVIAQNSISHLLPFSLSIAIFNKSGSATTAAAYIFIFWK